MENEVIHDIRLIMLEQTGEHKDKARANLLKYHKQIVRAYVAIVRPRVFKEGDFVLKGTTYVMRGILVPKFTL